MDRVVIGLFDTPERAHDATERLLKSGFARDNISLLLKNAAGEMQEVPLESTQGSVVEQEALNKAAVGATGGSVVGGLLGLLVGAGALVIPGIGPVIAAGTLATVLGTTALGAGVGAMGGGLAGGLTALGVHPNDVAYYTNAVREGGILVAAHASSDSQAQQAESILHRLGEGDVVRKRIAVAGQRAEELEKQSLAAPIRHEAVPQTMHSNDAHPVEQAKEVAAERKAAEQ